MRAKKKYETGTAAIYMTRNQALRKLQLNLKSFRQLCILKGIYPQQPRDLKKAMKGRSGGVNRTFYFVKDINFLSHEPLINKFRETKHFMRRLVRAVGKRNRDAEEKIKSYRPKFKLDHIVKERYPTFIDAVRDLDDCLSMCFLFASLPTSSVVNSKTVRLCRRLTVEFQNYVIASKSLRKVFISIKGFYFQVEIMGQTVTWLLSHRLGYQDPVGIDFKIMKTFTDFYTTLLGFINFRLYHSLNLHYPPQFTNVTHGQTDDLSTKCLDTESTEERLAAMSQSLKTIVEESEADNDIDDFPVSNPDDPDFVEKAKLEAEKQRQHQNLFTGKKFFLNREVPRETLAFIIRSFGGQVSWDKTLAVGSTFEEKDESISYQIVDRPLVDKQFLSRYYVQPQWVFDCVNSHMLVPVEDYFPGVILPPHLSPFVEEQDGDYIPAERKQQLRRQQGIDSGVEEDEDLEDEKEEEEEEADDDEEVVVNDEYTDSDEDEEDDSEDDDSDEEEKPKKKKSKKEEKTPVETPKPKQKKEMAVTPGSVEKLNANFQLRRQEDEEKKLAEMMIPRKKKYMYERIVKKRVRQERKVKQLTEKRKMINRNKKLEKAAGD